MLTRYQSESFPNVFIPSYDIDMDADLSSENGIVEFDNPSDNPQPEFPFLVRVGGGYRAFKTKRNATVYYNED